MRIALEFQRIATLAVRSDYSHTDLFDKYPSLRLATAAVNRGELFADTMTTKDHAFHFNADHQSAIPEESDASPCAVLSGDSRILTHARDPALIALTCAEVKGRVIATTANAQWKSIGVNERPVA
jgi:hypothetical protein